jgi:hypothetical protein
MKVLAFIMTKFYVNIEELDWIWPGCSTLECGHRPPYVLDYFNFHLEL